MLPLTYLHEPKGKDSALLLFLHGYTDSAASFLKRSLGDANLPQSILAPNGPFPLPVLGNNSFKEAYGWYFWDYAAGRPILHPNIAAGILVRLIDQLGYAHTPKLLIGFSQGGYFAPFLFPQLQNVRGLIALGAGFRTEDYPSEIPFPIIAIHGDQDTIVDAQRSQAGFEALRPRLPQASEYHLIPGMGHSIQDRASALLLEKIKHLLAD